MGEDGESWAAVDMALKEGHRGLAGGDSLARLLARCRGARNHTTIRPLSIRTILRWADAYHERTGKWPNHLTGSIPESPGDSWAAVESALRSGLRGLPGGSSIYKLLKDQRQIPGRSPWVRQWLPRSGQPGEIRIRLHLPPKLVKRYQTGEIGVWAIARACGATFLTVRRELVRAGVPIHGRGGSRGCRPPEHTKVVQRYVARATPVAIAKELGLSPKEVRAIVQRFRGPHRPPGPALYRYDLSRSELQRFGLRLRECRATLGWSQVELAERCGCTAATIGRLEAGLAAPLRTTVIRLARELRVRPTRFFA
jgi:DNA-binding XRE family transcriptional regulator